MVDPSVVREIEHNPLLWMHDRDDELNVAQSFLARDEDGNAYIDYLRVVLGESEDPDWVLQMHDEFINERLTLFAKDASIGPKYEWLRAYHDRTMAKMKARAANGYDRPHVASSGRIAPAARAAIRCLSPPRGTEAGTPGGQSHSRSSCEVLVAFRLLQLLPDAQNAPHYSGDGSGHSGSCLGFEGSACVA
jgi:hypothetical protein